ncbi:MAG: alpha/beta hydrolase [Planctomycetaceae bacterium]
MARIRSSFQAGTRLISAIVFMVVVATARSGFAADGEIVLETDLTYGQAGEVKLQLDLARPKEGNGPFPAIVFIHGGGWSEGSRNAFRPLAEEAAKRGYVAVTISYRLTEPDPQTHLGKVPFPAQIEDCKCAVRWLRSVADKYHVDRDHIGVSGGSAGGHLSLLVGLADETAGLEGNGGHADQSSRVQAVVNIFGPTDLSKAYQEGEAARPYFVALCGGTPDSAAEAYKKASPISYVSKDDPPVLTLHGEKDTLILVDQAKLLNETMKEVGVPHELLILPDQGHGFTGEGAKHANDALWAFFDKQLKKK